MKRVTHNVNSHASAVGGKRYGAVKGLIVRALKHGYRPAPAQVTIYNKDLSRLREWAKDNGKSIPGAFGAILDLAGIPNVPEKPGDLGKGKFSSFIKRMLERDRYDAVVLGKLLRDDYREEILEEFINR